MAFKYVALFALVAAASAISAPGYHHAPAPLVYHHAPAPAVYHHQPAEHHHIEHDTPPHYDFAYAVHDEHTGDVKSQHESRKDDKVHGSYSLIDADGYKRTVEYTADDHNGFQATVHREPLHHHVAPVVHHAPAPVHHYAPAPAPAHHNYHY